MSRLEVVRADSPRGEVLRARLAARGAEVLDAELVAEAERLVEEVRLGGDRALVEAVRRLDGVEIASSTDLRCPVAAVPQGELPDGFTEALEVAIGAVERFYRRQSAGGYELRDRGVTLAERRRPLGRIGVYVPGGRAVYPSTVVMSVVPARIAGVAEIVLATPPAAWRASSALRWTAHRLGIEEVWGMGGAHAVAALAYGTETIRRVDKIVGPGNAWVAAAKQRVAAVGAVAVDGLAGPTEVVVVAERGADAAWTAADLLAQAEHDPRAAAVLITDSGELAAAVSDEIDRQLPELATRETAEAALAAFGCALVVEEIGDALALIEEIAPEHLQLVGSGAEALAPQVDRAGALFVGAASSEVFGDYVAGPSHVLPTCGTARFASAMGIEDFARRSHAVSLDPAAAARLAGPAATLAEAEGLPAHAAAARRRAAGGAGAPKEPAERAGADPADWVRPEIRQLSAYHLDRPGCRYKLDQNEMPWPLPERLRRRVAEDLLAADWESYPDFHADALRQALGRRHGHPPSGVLLGNGSGELLSIVLEALVSPGAEVLGMAPGFSLYRSLVRRVSGVARFLGPRADLALPIDELEAEVERDPSRPLLVCSPNNPTGEALEPERLARLLARNRAPVLLDNAYGEFCRWDYRPLLAEHRHLVIFRTFSKAWALAGLRLGYLLADPSLVDELVKVKLPYNLGHAGIAAGLATLEAEPLLGRRVELVRRRRRQWSELLTRHGLEVFPSEANFVLARTTPAEARRLRDGLAQRSILVRDIGRGAGLAGCFRVTVGTGAALRATAAALDELGEAVPAAVTERMTTNDRSAGGEQ